MKSGEAKLNTKPLVLLPSPILLTPCTPVTQFDETLHSQLNEMKAAMYAAPGVGLAGNQLGYTNQVFVMDKDGNSYTEVINPRPMATYTSAQIMSNEGCLSVPGHRGEVIRDEEVEILYQDRFGQERHAVAFGFEATIVQHEMDHLNGKLFIHRLPRQQRRFIEKRFK